MTEMEIQEIMAEAGLAPGAQPLTRQQLNDRIMAVMERDWPLPMREARPEDYQAWRAEMEPARFAAVAANLFNIRLAAYREAVERLARYRLAEGRAEQRLETPTGVFDAEGAEIVDTVVVPAVAPLPAEIETPVIDPQTGEQTGVEMVANPAIAEDDAERAAAQAVLDATPEEVRAFAEATL